MGSCILYGGRDVSSPQPQCRKGFTINSRILVARLLMGMIEQRAFDGGFCELII